MKIIEKIEELFGAEIVIKSKKVKELVEGNLVRYTEGEGEFQSGLHFFQTEKKYKVGKSEFDIVLKASQMKSGKWWIQG